MARPRFRDVIPALMAARGKRSVLPVGLGRSYGDTVLNTGGCLIGMTSINRVIAFDCNNGVLRADAGLSLDDALRIIVPRGWFLCTTPGTRFVTLGGAVANDVHGKNHHVAGAFGRSVRRLGLIRSDGSRLELDRQTGGELLRATIGGLGLTGVIDWLEIDLTRIPSSELLVEYIPFGNIRGFFELARQAGEGYEHTVAWIDCANRGRALGRGIFQRANWAAEGALVPHAMKLKASMPIDAPSMILNSFTVRAFNSVYWHAQKLRPPRQRCHYASVFYPLDVIGHWNRLYGRRGFYQYQCMVPPQTAEPAVTELVRQIAKAGAGSFLAILKTFGPLTSPGMLSFAHEGATLALDFANNGAATTALLARLDDVVIEAKGRLYAAKDGRMPAKMFRAGYPEHVEFAHHVDRAFSSDFWRRVST
jgi:L-gulonolactone oxidase